MGLFKRGDKVRDQVGNGGEAEVLERRGRGQVDDSQYVRVRWADGHETSEPVWRFGGKRGR